MATRFALSAFSAATTDEDVVLHLIPVVAVIASLRRVSQARPDPPSGAAKLPDVDPQKIAAGFILARSPAQRATSLMNASSDLISGGSSNMDLPGVVARVMWTDTPDGAH